MKKRLLSIILSSAMFLNTSVLISAYELDSNNNSIEKVTYQNSEDENFQNLSTVFAEIGNQYKITIPKTIVLSGLEKKASYYVKVKGDISGYEGITVIPDKNFNLYSVKKEKQNAAISQDKTYWLYNNFDVDANGLIEADGITAGKWQGTFNFNIEMVKVLGDIVILPYDEDNSIINLPYGSYEVPNSEKQYTSLNPDIVNFDEDGNLVAKTKGTATVVVTDENNEKNITINVTNNIQSAPGKITYIYHHHSLTDVNESTETQNDGLYADNYHASSSGGCFTQPVYKVHSHKNSCYATGTCWHQNSVYILREYYDDGRDKAVVSCQVCGQIGYGSGSNREDARYDAEYNDLKKHPYTYSSIACGKTPGVRYASEGVDYYQLSCGHKDGQIVNTKITY